ncbi:MAG TPA: hypothetical protein VI386_17920 [Candidatus Sulfotelmatobacter sp.]
MPEIELETPVDVAGAVQQDPSADGGTPADAAKPEEPYLSVNERTVYKTKDDAIRGYNEAASRIAQLSGWEKTAKQYGLTDPKNLEAIAKELLESRQKLADAAKQASVPKVDPADPKAKETEQVRKYLKDLGYISREDQETALKTLQERLDKFEQSGKQSEELRFQNQEAEARNDVGSWLSQAGIKDDATGTKLQVVGTLVRDFINNDEERVAQWTKGGLAARAVVKEAYDYAMKALDWKAPVDPAKPANDAAYAANKAKAVATNKKLPAPGTAKETATRVVPKQKGAINAELHEKAYKLFKEMETK